MGPRKQALGTAGLGACAVLTVPLYEQYGSAEVLTIGAGLAAVAIGVSAVLALESVPHSFAVSFAIGLLSFPIAYGLYVAVGFIPLSIPSNGIYVPAVFGVVALSFPLGFAASERQQALVILAIGTYLLPVQRILSQVGGVSLRQEPAEFGLIALAGLVLLGVLTALFVPGYRLGRTVRANRQDPLPSPHLPVAFLAALLTGLVSWLLYLGVTYPIAGLGSYWLVVGVVVFGTFVVAAKVLGEYWTVR
jgi:hypothetical protein